MSETADQFDIFATTAGGGVSGQAGALRLGIARALVQYRAELRPQLKKAGLLSRDPQNKRAKEIRPSWGPQALPVQQAVDEKDEQAVSRQPSAVRRAGAG